MMLIKFDRLVRDDWRHVGDDEALPIEGPATVSLERWRAEREKLFGRNGPLGIRLKSDQGPDEIAADLDRFGLIVLDFPKFTDGRPYSHARLLRQRHGFEGELRAAGNVLRDQMLFMHRCGFDAFEVADSAMLDGWLKAQTEIGIWYQPGADRRRPVSALRHPEPDTARPNRVLVA